MIAPVVRKHEPKTREDGYPTDNLIQSLDDYQLLKYMGVPQKYHRYAVQMQNDSFHPVIDGWLEDLSSVYRPKPDAPKPELFGKGLILHGAARKHKTTVAVALLLRLVRMGIHNNDPGMGNSWDGWCMGRFEDWQDLSELFRDAVSDEGSADRAFITRRALIGEGPYEKRGDFLVLDDISRERGTDFNTGMLTRIIRARSDWGYPSIITTNYPPDKWSSVYQSEALSAFLHDEFLPVAF